METEGIGGATGAAGAAGGTGDIGAETQAQGGAVRLMICLFLSYPLAFAYNKWIKSFTANTQYFIFTIIGLCLCWFYCGSDIWHSLLGVAVTIISLNILGGTLPCVVFNFVFHCGHLGLGYIFTSTDSYDITWTMPHCILVLKLIGLAFDCYDGRKKNLSASARLNALDNIPSILEITAFAYFPPGFFIGPQFTMRRFLDFVSGKYEGEHVPSAESHGILRGSLGLGYLIIFRIASIYFYDEHLTTEDFANGSFFGKHLYMAIWGKVVFCKYVACWLLAEGSCIITGIAHNGKDEKSNETKWDACRNIRLGIFERIDKFADYPRCFNVNTNAWVARCIYKRCAFLGSKPISQAISLFFLAAWHGFHSGYYMAFFMEFITLVLERDVEFFAAKYPAIGSFFMDNGIVTSAFMWLRRAYVLVFMGWALVPFTLLTWDRWWPVYRTLGYSGFVLFVPWVFLYKPVLIFILNRLCTKADKQS